MSPGQRAPGAPGRRRLLCAGALLALGGCALPPRRPATAERPRWDGRLGLQVEGDPSQSFSAAFSLHGSAADGELSLFTPLGSTAAILTWEPGRARLRTEGQPPQDDVSVDALVARLTGTAVPIAALFDWLAGRATAVAGWQPDLSRLGDGRLRARRVEPAPPIDLRVVLESLP